MLRVATEIATSDTLDVVVVWLICHICSIFYKQKVTQLVTA